MTYIRIKKKSNNSYAYLVESKNTPQGPRQKVKRYLGKVYDAKKTESTKTVIQQDQKTDFLQSLTLRELQQHGFQPQKQQWYYTTNDNISLIFSPKTLTLQCKQKEAILAINDGFLSSFTLQRIKRFRKTDDLQRDATLLAHYFLEAGILISQQEFVDYYQLL